MPKTNTPGQRNYLRRLIETVGILDGDGIERLYIALKYTEGRIFTCGNGGSAALASHFANDLTKIAGIPAQCLADNPAAITSYGNDHGFDFIFSDQISRLGRRGDILFAISCSGESKNVVAAAGVARRRRMTVLSLTGFGGGRLKKASHLSVHVESFDYGVVEPIHDLICHWLIDALKK